MCTIVNVCVREKGRREIKRIAEDEESQGEETKRKQIGRGQKEI